MASTFSVFSNSGHVGWMSGLPDTILKGGHQRTKQSLVPIDPVALFSSPAGEVLPSLGVRRPSVNFFIF
jgi:hypothetical protein